MKFESNLGNYMFEIDGDWISEENKDPRSEDIISKFTLPNQPVSLNVISGFLYPNEDTDMKTRKKGIKDYMKRQGYKKLNIKDILIPNVGIEALDARYVIKTHDLHLTARKVELHYKNKTYIFSFSAIPSEFIRYEPFFNQVLQTFKII